MTCENLHKGDIVESHGRKKVFSRIDRDCPRGHHEVLVYDSAEAERGLGLKCVSYFDDRPHSIFGKISQLRPIT